MAIAEPQTLNNDYTWKIYGFQLTKAKDKIYTYADAKPKQAEIVSPFCIARVLPDPSGVSAQVVGSKVFARVAPKGSTWNICKVCDIPEDLKEYLIENACFTRDDFCLWNIPQPQCSAECWVGTFGCFSVNWQTYGVNALLAHDGKIIVDVKKTWCKYCDCNGFHCCLRCTGESTAEYLIWRKAGLNYSPPQASEFYFTACNVERVITEKEKGKYQVQMLDLVSYRRCGSCLVMTCGKAYNQLCGISKACVVFANDAKNGVYWFEVYPPKFPQSCFTNECYCWLWDGCSSYKLRIKEPCDCLVCCFNCCVSCCYCNTCFTPIICGYCADCSYFGNWYKFKKNASPVEVGAESVDGEQFTRLMFYTACKEDWSRSDTVRPFNGYFKDTPKKLHSFLVSGLDVNEKVERREPVEFCSCTYMKFCESDLSFTDLKSAFKLSAITSKNGKPCHICGCDCFDCMGISRNIRQAVNYNGKVLRFADNSKVDDLRSLLQYEIAKGQDQYCARDYCKINGEIYRDICFSQLLQGDQNLLACNLCNLVNEDYFLGVTGSFYRQAGNIKSVIVVNGDIIYKKARNPLYIATCYETNADGKVRLYNCHIKTLDEIKKLESINPVPRVYAEDGLRFLGCTCTTGRHPASFVFCADGVNSCSGFCSCVFAWRGAK